MPLYIGFDSSTQGLTAVVIEIEGDGRRVVLETSLSFDEALPQYGTTHGVLHHPDPAVAHSSPLLWAEALDLMVERLARSGLELRRLAAIAGSAQQHGSVYLNRRAEAVLGALDPTRPLAGQVRPTLSRETAPIWMDSSTTAQCAEIADAVGGDVALAQNTGSRAFERFTGPQIRKFFQRAPEAYAATDRIHLVSSFLASLLAGRHAPLDPGDASGMNLMELTTRRWWPRALEATAPGLAAKLPPIVEPWTTIGTLSPYWRERYGLPAAKVIAWSGDNPSSLVGLGLVREGTLALSLGTSDTVFGPMREPRVDRSGTGHVFGAPTGEFMGLTCFRNGSLARERVRAEHGLSWSGFSQALERSPAGNDGRILLPWFEPEITPTVLVPGAHRYGPPIDSPASAARAVVEAQQMSLMLHSRWMGVQVDRIHATGGASANPQILQVMADVFDADVYRLEVGNSAALGAALRAAHADLNENGGDLRWDEIVRGLAEPVASSRVRAVPAHHALYRELLPIYAACEAHALGRAPDPAALIESFRRKCPGKV